MAVSFASRQEARRRAQGLCEYCHANERWQFVRFTIDHVVPQSLGGSDEIDNLALACRNCNERRGNRTRAADPAVGSVADVFDPRSDVWNDHFAWDDERLRIVGQTDTGRATAELLDFNDERHGGAAVRIRRRDRDDGYHPPEGDRIQSESSGNEDR